MGLVLVRNQTGAFLVGLNSSMTFSAHPINAEFHVLWRTLELCNELVFENVRFEGDAQVLIKAVNGEEACGTWYRILKEDVKLVLKYRSLWTITFIHREGNMFAHVLAKHGLLLSNEAIWVVEPSNVIIPFIIFDISI